MAAGASGDNQMSIGQQQAQGSPRTQERPSPLPKQPTEGGYPRPLGQINMRWLAASLFAVLLMGAIVGLSLGQGTRDRLGRAEPTEQALAAAVVTEKAPTPHLAYTPLPTYTPYPTPTSERLVTATPYPTNTPNRPTRHTQLSLLNPCQRLPHIQPILGKLPCRALRLRGPHRPRESRCRSGTALTERSSPRHPLRGFVIWPLAASWLRVNRSSAARPHLRSAVPWGLARATSSRPSGTRPVGWDTRSST